MQMFTKVQLLSRKTLFVFKIFTKIAAQPPHNWALKTEYPSGVKHLSADYRMYHTIVRRLVCRQAPRITLHLHI